MTMEATTSTRGYLNQCREFGKGCVHSDLSPTGVFVFRVFGLRTRHLLGIFPFPRDQYHQLSQLVFALISGPRLDHKSRYTVPAGCWL